MKYNKYVKFWLLLGAFMLVIQVLVGGITRLTGSGLSITKWEIITGTFPPSTEVAWNEAFELYKSTPQYEKINIDMELGSIFKSGSFKFIYFWEYIHRLWARTMGFVFLFPCILFWFLGWVDKSLLKKLSVVILLAVLAASFGWIMVASGLIERPWVNAYKLSLHLCIGLSVYGAMLWTCLFAFNTERVYIPFKRIGIGFTMLLVFQLFMGGIMSGMKAGLFYPTWPDMNGQFIPSVVFDFTEYTYENFNQYDKNLLMPALIQFIHRSTAYALFLFCIWYCLKLYRKSNNRELRNGSVLLFVFIIIQIVVGILTVINCKGNIPIGLGVLHQGLALILLSISLYLNYKMKSK